MSMLDESTMVQGDGFRYSRDPVTQSLRVVVPPRRRASIIAFLVFGLAFCCVFGGFAVHGLRWPSQPPQNALDALGPWLIVAFALGMSLLLLWVLGSHLFQRSIVEITRTEVSVRRRRLLTRTMRAAIAEGPGFRLGPVQHIQKLYWGGESMGYEHAPTGVEMVLGERSLRFAEQLQGEPAQRLLDLIIAACPKTGAPGRSVARNIRVYEDADSLTITMRSSFTRWFATIIQLGVGAGTFSIGFSVVQNLVAPGGLQGMGVMFVLPVLAGAAVPLFVLWYVAQTVTGREMISVADGKLVIHRTSIFGTAHREIRLDSITSLRDEQPGHRESTADGIKGWKGILFGTAVVSRDAGDIRFGRFGFLDQGRVLVAIINEHRQKPGNLGTRAPGSPEAITEC